MCCCYYFKLAKVSLSFFATEIPDDTPMARQKRRSRKKEMKSMIKRKIKWEGYVQTYQ